MEIYGSKGPICHGCSIRYFQYNLEVSLNRGTYINQRLEHLEGMQTHPTLKVSHFIIQFSNFM